MRNEEQSGRVKVKVRWWMSWLEGKREIPEAKIISPNETTAQISDWTLPWWTCQDPALPESSPVQRPSEPLTSAHSVFQEKPDSKAKHVRVNPGTTFGSQHLGIWGSKPLTLPCPAKMSRISSLNINARDVAAIDLGRVLERLEKMILSQDADPRLLHSSLERTKAAAVSSPRSLISTSS